MFGSSLVGSNSGQTYLSQYLWDAYMLHLEETFQKKGKPPGYAKEAVKFIPATHYAKWVHAFLDRNRAVEVVNSGGTIGVRFSNNAIVLISPPSASDSAGSMPDSPAIQVLDGKGETSAPSLRVDNSPALRI